MMINACYHHLGYPSVSTFLNKLAEALSVFQICWVRGPAGLDCASCRGQTLMKIIEDVIRRMCLLSEIAYAVITLSYTSLISIFHGFALPFINCMTLCHWRRCEWWSEECCCTVPSLLAVVWSSSVETPVFKAFIAQLWIKKIPGSGAGCANAKLVFLQNCNE